MRAVAFLLGALVLGSVPQAAGAPVAASLAISTKSFAPDSGPMTITAHVDRVAPVGLRLASLADRPLGWIDPPSGRTDFSDTWDGTLDGNPVREGYYQVELVVSGRTLAAEGFHLDRTPAQLLRLHVTSNSTPFAGDGPLLATLTANGDGFRDYAEIGFDLTEPATVTLNVQRTGTTAAVATIYTRTWGFRQGHHSIGWVPLQGIPARTYVLSLTTVDTAGNQLTYGSPDARVRRYPRAPVVRVLGVDATFTKQSYAPGQVGAVRISTDEPSLTMQILKTGPETFVTYADNLLEGEPVTQPKVISWTRFRDRTGTLPVRIGLWPSGLYFVKLTAPDKTIGYAPFVLRPAVPGAASRVLVVLPTNSWQAYNFYDADGDGWGDTWYAGPPHQTTTLDRPFLHRGVPPFFYRYDQGFLHWLYWNNHTVDFMAESDVAGMSGDRLASLYDLIVYNGHSEYATVTEYDAIQRFRDRGGNLMFLSSNNFFRRVDRTGTTLHKIAQWRSRGEGRPEAALLGVQYLANDEGQHQGLYSVTDATAVPWLWAGTGLTDGSTFGAAVGGYGIEIDHTTDDSPPGTIVVADIADLFGPGLTAQMSYYETPAGAKVFAAGTMDFGGSAITDPISQILENLWTRLTKP